MSDREFTQKDFAKGETPAFPLKASGAVWHTGWDIPSYWAVDAGDVPYADYGAHGCSMTRTTFKDLLTHIEEDNEEMANELRKKMSMKQKMSKWMTTAFDAGWTPPETFKREDYE